MKKKTRDKIEKLQWIRAKELYQFAQVDDGTFVPHSTQMCFTHFKQAQRHRMGFISAGFFFVCVCAHAQAVNVNIVMIWNGA